MAIAITSKYKPFTYEDYIKPLEQYTKDYKAQEEKIQKELTDIASLESLIYDEALKTNEDNLEYINQYSNYVKSLNDLTDKLYNEGFDRRTQGQAFLDTQKVYNSKIKPLALALTGMQKAHIEEAKLRQQGFILGKGADNWSISDYYGMNTPEETAKVSLDSIEKNTAEIAKSITNAMETKYSISKKSIINGALAGYTSEKGINALEYAQNSGKLTAEELNLVGLIENKVQARILNDLGYTKEEYDALDSNTKLKINERIHTGLIKGLTHGESITPRRRTDGDGGGGGGYKAPYWHITANGVTSSERAFKYAQGLNNAVENVINEYEAKGATVKAVYYGGQALEETPLPAGRTEDTMTESDLANHLKYDVRNASWAVGTNSSIPIVIEYTTPGDPKVKTKIVGQVKGNMLTNTQAGNDEGE